MLFEARSDMRGVDGAADRTLPAVLDFRLLRWRPWVDGRGGALMGGSEAMRRSAARTNNVGSAGPSAHFWPSWGEPLAISRIGNLQQDVRVTGPVERAEAH